MKVLIFAPQTNQFAEVRAEEILAALDDEQREVVLATRGPVCVIAGAGTGKTKAITHRIAYCAAIGVMNPQKVLALTFTARAAGEMRTRLRSLGVAKCDCSNNSLCGAQAIDLFSGQVFSAAELLIYFQLRLATSKKQFHERDSREN
ncbi:MAG: UvrD-helicase domain-containing protein [Actinomycetota bacterium]